MNTVQRGSHLADVEGSESESQKKKEPSLRACTPNKKVAQS